MGNINKLLIDFAINVVRRDILLHVVSVNSNTEKKESLAKVNQINNHLKVENQSDSEP